MISDAEPPRTFRTPSDVSGARASWTARVIALARRLSVPVDRARAMTFDLSSQRGITTTEGSQS
jgi:hypothetical protein